MLRPQHITNERSSQRNGLPNTFKSRSLALNGKSVLPALKTGNNPPFLPNEDLDPALVNKYKQLAARNRARKITTSRAGSEYYKNLEIKRIRESKESESLQPKATEAPTEENVDPQQTPMSRPPEIQVSRSESPNRKKPTKLPSLVMVPSMVIGDINQLKKLRRPSQVKNVKDVQVHELIELRPLVDEKDENISPTMDKKTKGLDRARKALAKSLWFPVNERNIHRIQPFSEQGRTGDGTFEKHLQARINSYIRNQSPGGIRRALDFTKTQLPPNYTHDLNDDNVNLHFHFSQLELEVGKSLDPNGVSPTPITEMRGKTSKPTTPGPDPLESTISARQSPILLRKGLRNALKLPPGDCPRASMRSQIVQVEGLKSPLKTLKLRNDYAKNLERNWMRKHMVQQRQKRKEKEIRQTVTAWVNARVNMKTQDFSLAFYSSDDASSESSDIEDVFNGNDLNASIIPHISVTNENDRSPDEDASIRSNIASRQSRNSVTFQSDTISPTKDNHVHSDSGMKVYIEARIPINSGSLDIEHEDELSYASMDVQFSDFENEDDRQAIEIVLQDGRLVDRYVKNKTKRRLRRREKRFETLVYPVSSEEEEEEQRDEEHISKMTDTELRAMRLKLDKKDEDDDAFDPHCSRGITSALLRDLSRLTESGQKKKKKKKKKKSTKKQVQTLSVRERFVQDFGWLLDQNSMNRLLANKSLFPATSSQCGENVSLKDENAEPANTMTSFLNTIDEDIKALQSMDPTHIGKKQKEKKAKTKILRRKKEFQKIYLEKMAKFRSEIAERNRLRQAKIGAGEEVENLGEEEAEDSEMPEEEIKPEEWEYVTESESEESETEEERQKKMERRNSFAGREKPSTLTYRKLIEKPIPVQKPKSPTKSVRSGRSSSKIGSPIKRSTPFARHKTDSENIKDDASVASEKQNVDVPLSPHSEKLDDISADNSFSKENSTVDPDAETGSQCDSRSLTNEGTEQQAPDKSPDEPPEGYMYDTVDTELNTRVIRRTKSWTRLKWNEEEISLHDLLDGIDLPAKEVKIQIVSRRRKRQRQKMEQEQRELEAKHAAEATERALQNADEYEELSDNESIADSCATSATTCTMSMISFSEDAPFLSAFLQWNRAKGFKSDFTDEQLDEDIEDLSDLFWQMKDCRYLRWNKRDQAIITRLFELDLFDR